MIKEQGVKLTAILEPQSPMIHFQPGQIGSVLRASEVKPKLDRFLIRKMMKNLMTNNELTDEEALKKMKKDHPQYFRDVKLNDALNYKMQIAVHSNDGQEQRVQFDLKTYKIFYGNTGSKGKKDLKEGILAELDLTIICFNRELRHIIRNYLEEFFIVTNFGTMQGKGFGSFIVADSVGTDLHGNQQKMTSDEIKRIAQLLENEVDSDNCYYMEFDAVDNVAVSSDADSCLNGTYNKMFDEIKLFYGIMKSGYNIGQSYARSYIYEYMHDKYNIGNEKKWMKQKTIAPAIMKPTRISANAQKRNSATQTACKTILDSATEIIWEKRQQDIVVKTDQGDCNEIRNLVRSEQNAACEEGERFRYVRALLGTAIQTEFKTGYNKKDQEWVLLSGKDESDKVQVTIADSSEELERVPSPIYFKIIKNIVFIVARKIPKEIYERKFNFSSRWESGEISTPSKEELTDRDGQVFDIQKFLESYIEYYNDKDGLRMKVPSVRKAKTIKKLIRREEANE